MPEFRKAVECCSPETSRTVEEPGVVSFSVVRLVRLSFCFVEPHDWDWYFQTFWIFLSLFLAAFASLSTFYGTGMSLAFELLVRCGIGCSAASLIASSLS